MQNYNDLFTYTYTVYLNKSIQNNFCSYLIYSINVQCTCDLKLGTSTNEGTVYGYVLFEHVYLQKQDMTPNLLLLLLNFIDYTSLKQTTY